MNASSANADRIRYRLRTFGSVGLSGLGEDTLLEKQGQQRRRLALLAVLAAAGESGKSRDQLLLLFWPDATQTRARHSLEQLLYAIRGSLSDDVFDGVNPIRLNESIVSSDVVDFRSAEAGHDFESAIRLYSGPFLDGFYLSDAPEFEQWAAAERSRLELSYTTMLENLALGAQREGNHALAVSWWRKLVDTDPLSTRNAAGLIRSLIESGDHAAAIKFAEQYEALVSRELGTNAGAEVTALVAEARAGGKADVPADLPARASRPQRVNVGDEKARAAADDGPPVIRQRGFSWKYIAAALAVIVFSIAAILAANARKNQNSSSASASLAVLPFRDLNSNPADAVILEGLTEEMISVLAKIPGLRVMAPTSSSVFANSKIGVQRIADTLGVDNILEGSIQRNDSLLRVRVRLVSHDGSTRWSETYDRKMGDIFLVQSDIARAVANELDLRLAPRVVATIKRGATTNIVAYELYLRGMDPAATRTDSGARASLAFFDQAIALDSGYAAAYAGRARMQLRVAYGLDSLSLRAKRVVEAKAAAMKAIALDDSLSDGHAALSFIYRQEYNFERSKAELQRAIELDPGNARVHEWMAQFFIWADKPDDALNEGRRAVALDPLAPTAHAELASALASAGRCDEALARLERLKSLRPPLLRASTIAARCYARQKLWSKGLAELERIKSNSGNGGEALRTFFIAESGRRDEALSTLTRFIERSRQTGHGSFDIATIYAGLGDADKAFSWLDSAYADRSVRFESLPNVLDVLRGDPRLDQFRRKMGLQ